ncbi:MAG: imidazole glycerol phosphate synthase subunit HisH [Candidatus Omnitrophica bacterium]|nr:imidazole glycerol phosphate synthase subunit HisH [Candidatus Omnitrophota bacterium]
MIAVIDYGMGNLRSVSKALEKLGAEVRVTSNGADIESSSKLVFPGVGAFLDCMNGLKERELVSPIKEFIKSKKPFLGICMGLQLLFETSEEAPGTAGLGVLKGGVRRFSPVAGQEKLKVPHIGWNQIRFSGREKNLPLFRGVEDESFVYFVHSYYAVPNEPEITTTLTSYGVDFCSSLNKDNIYATQFHPEKSQSVGLKILENFCRL